MQRLVPVLVLSLLAPLCSSAADAPPRRDGGVHYLYLVRHGWYERDDHVDDRAGNGLDALGREQARLLGSRLRALPVRPDAIVSSDFLRAKDTAAILGRSLGMPVAIDTLIHECSPPSEGNAASTSHPAEEVARCESNLSAAWEEYARPTPDADRRDVLVCHGNVIRYLVSRALGMDAKRWPVMEIANASLTVIAVRPDGTTRLVMFSDVGHLPPAKQTWTGRGARWGMVPARRP